MPSPFVSTAFKLRRVTRVLQGKEVLNVPSVNYALASLKMLVFWTNRL
jgi:hypothetical protein